MQRHYMEDMGNICPFVQILDVPAPQMEFFRLLDLPVAEQVIEVPKVSSPQNVDISMPRSLSSGRCPCYAGRAGFSGSGCGGSRRDPTVAAR